MKSNSPLWFHQHRFSWIVLTLIAVGGLLCFSAQTLATPVGVPGDVDANGIVDSTDIDLLGTMLGGFNPAGDMNDDGIVNQTDFDLWFNFYSTVSGVPLAIALVDVNFDRGNSFADYSIIFTNQSLLTTNFTSGNLNGDGVINRADLDLYLSRGGIIPEPTSAILGTFALVGLLFRRRAVPLGRHI